MYSCYCMATVLQFRNLKFKFKTLIDKKKKPKKVEINIVMCTMWKKFENLHNYNCSCVEDMLVVAIHLCVFSQGKCFDIIQCHSV